MSAVSDGRAIEGPKRSSRRYTSSGVLKRMLLEVRPFWAKLGALFVLTLLATPLFLLTPVPLKIAIDSVVGSRPLPGVLYAVLPDAITRSDTALLVFVAVLQVLVVLLAQIQSLTSYVLQTQVGEAITLNFRARLFAHLQRLSLSYHDQRGSADSMYRVQWDAPAIQWVTTSGLVPFISSLVLVVAMLYVIARIDWLLALVAVAVVPLLILVSRTFDRHMRPRYKDLHGLDTSALGVVQEALGAFRVVKAFGREQGEEQRFLHRSGKSFRVRIRLSFFEGGYQLVVNLIIAVGAALVLYFGISRVLSGAMSLGDVVLVAAYLVQAYAPMADISQQVAAMQTALASGERSFELLDEAPDVVERPGARPLERAAGAIEFRDVSFSYDDRNTVLHSVSFAIEPGTRAGIAGRTGAGKTTLVNLLARFYDPDSGAVLLDGIDLRDYKVADVRAQLGVVLQEPVLFSTTIRENVSYARPGATLDEIVRACRAANAHEFIVELPDGYDTVVGERGMRLSGGERQRISLARAFLKDAPILVLDEPTSSVDTRTEAIIMEAMERLMGGRTTLMIAHRLGSLEHCDVRIEVEKGRVTGDGRPRPFARSSSRVT